MLQDGKPFGYERISVGMERTSPLAPDREAVLSLTLPLPVVVPHSIPHLAKQLQEPF